jgi:hypothetical protein
LLAYFSEVNNSFEQNCLYPHFSEIIEHYKNIISVKQKKKVISDAFPNRLQKIDMEKFNIEYQKVIQDDHLFAELEQIIDFSIPKFEHYLREGKKIFEFLEQQMTLSPVGIVPIKPDYGYLILKNGGQKLTHVYEYHSTIFESPEERYRGIQILFIDTYSKNISTTYEFIKSDLLRRNRDLANPATYVIESEIDIPLKESLLPVAKRMLMKQISEV